MLNQLVTMISIGMFAGMVTGLTGASAVMVVVPLVNLLLGFSVHESIGVSLMVDVIASLAISYTYYKHGNVDLKSGIWVAIGSVLGAQLGAIFAAKTSEISLGGAFGTFLILTGIVIWRKGLNREILGKIGKVMKFKTNSRRIATVFISGLAVGVMTGIFGAGGGAMVFLILVFVLSFPIHLAVGTSTLIMAITASSGMIGYALQRSVRPIAGLILGASAAFGGIVSARFANEVNEKVLAKIVGAIFMLLGAVMVITRLV